MRSLTPFRPSPHKAATALSTFRTNAHSIILSTLFALLTTLSSSAQPTAYFKLVTSNNELVAGEKYIICVDLQDSESLIYMDKLQSSGDTSMSTSKVFLNTFYNMMIPLGTAMQTFTLEKNDDNSWKLAIDESSYLQSNSSSSSSSSADFKKGGLNTYSYFTIDIQEESYFAVIKNTNNKKQVLYYNGDIKCYSSTTNKKSIYLYKHECDIYTRQKSTANFGTICIPHNVDSPNETGARYYNVVGKKIENGEPTGIYLEQTDELTAGVPYIYKFTSEWLAIPYQEPIVTEAKEAMGLVGNLSQSTIYVPQDAYVLSGDKLWKVAGNEYLATIKPNRAYITIDDLPEYGETQSKAVFFPIVDSSTGINIQTKDCMKGEEKVFTITGQAIKGLHKGIIISRKGKFLLR